MGKMLTLLAVLSIAVVFFLIRSEQSHRALHDSLALSGIVHDGATVGVVAEELRREGALPLERGAFLERYKLASSVKWHVSTNTAGDLEFSLEDYITLRVDRNQGTVRLFASANPEAPNALSILRSIDFSKPLIGANMPRVPPDLTADFDRAADMVWSTYPGRKK